jgi:hypothetical protein
VTSPRHVLDALGSDATVLEASAPPSWSGGRWVQEPPAGSDVGEALQVLQAIRVLQRWVDQRPLGADTLYLTATSLALIEGEQVVSVIRTPSV